MSPDTEYIIRTLLDIYRAMLSTWPTWVIIGSLFALPYISTVDYILVTLACWVVLLLAILTWSGNGILDTLTGAF